MGQIMESVIKVGVYYGEKFITRILIMELTILYGL